MFNIKEDLKIEREGGFWCQGCLMSQPIEKQSLDNRYCNECFEFLKEEARLLGAKSPGWVPQMPPDAPETLLEGKIKSLQTKPMEMDVEKPSIILLHTKRGKTLGRPAKKLPVTLILKLSKQGFGIRDIARQLGEQGHSVSAMSVSRVLSGQRSKEVSKHVIEFYQGKQKSKREEFND